MRVAEAVAAYLADKGCTHAFGIVGGANSLLFHAISERMEMTCHHHEQAAAMAATAYYRICRKIAPVVVTAGGGSANTITGVMAAHMDNVPLLVISGQEKSMYVLQPPRRSVGFQGFIPGRVVGSFTKHVLTADNTLGVMLALEALYSECLSERKGACWLDIPQDIAAMEEG